MKSIIAACIVLLISQGELVAQNTGYTHEFVNQVANTKSDYIEVPSTFSENEISKNRIEQALQGKTIEKIELIYTQFKLNPKFDQVKLNNDRIAQLQKAFPQTKNNGIDWIWIEQTGAKTVEDARDYYHGFRIYYSEPANRPIAESIKNSEKFHRYQFEDEANKPTQYVVNNSKGGDIKHPSGTVIHVPANCVLTPDGKPVVGSYIIEYTEYRDAAQIAYSGIPMEYSENGEKFNFSSVGMYELRGKQNNQELSLSKPITVDFNSNEVAEEVGFYEMDDDTGQWVKKHDVTYPAVAADSVVTINNPKEISKDAELVAVAPKGGFGIDATKLTVKAKDPNRNLQELTLTKAMQERYEQLKTSDKEAMDKMVISENPENMSVIVNTYNTQVFENKIRGIDQSQFQSMWQGADVGHVFPTMVTGLRSANFGVYNCDQISRIQNAVTASPTYKIKDSLTNFFLVACVIDRSVNGSFSFSPSNLTYSKSANTTILLFTPDGNLSVVTEPEVKKSNGNKTPRFEIVDLSAIVHDSAELKEYLKL